MKPEICAYVYLFGNVKHSGGFSQRMEPMPHYSSRRVSNLSLSDRLFHTQKCKERFAQLDKYYVFW